MKPLKQRELYAEYILKEIEKSGILVEKCGTNEPTEDELFREFSDQKIGYSFRALARFLRKESIPYQQNLNEIAKLFQVKPDSIYTFLNEKNLAKKKIDGVDYEIEEVLSQQLESIKVQEKGAASDYAKSSKDLIASLSKLCDQMSSSLYDILQNEIVRDKDSFLSETFSQVIRAIDLSTSLKLRIDSFFNNAHVGWEERSVLASALTISNLRYFEDQKMDYLLKLATTEEEDANSDVWHKACIGYFAGYHRKPKIRDKYIKRLEVLLGQKERLKVLLTFIKTFLEIKISKQKYVCPVLPKVKESQEYFRFFPFNVDEEIYRRLPPRERQKKIEAMQLFKRSNNFNNLGKWILALPENDEIFAHIEKLTPKLKKEFEFYETVPLSEDVNKMIIIWAELLRYKDYIYDI